MGWKNIFLILFALILLINIVLAQPFGPPIYIANPDNLECRYYFAGDEKHFNPKPENYTISIGYTTDFKDLEQACSLFKCQYTDGLVLLQDKDDLNPDICLCPEGFQFVNETGCTSMQKATGFAVKESKAGVFSKGRLLVFFGIIVIFVLGAFFGVKFLGKK